MDESTKKTVEFTIAKLHETAAAMEPTVRHVYDVLVRQAYAEGLAALVPAGVALVVLLMAAFTWKTMMEWQDREEFPGIVLNMGAIVVGILVFCNYITSAILHLANPEYYAIMDILGRGN